MILYVPRDFISIQEAVDASKPGDTIKVTEGKYNEVVKIKLPDITLEALLGVEMDGDFISSSAFEIYADNVTIDGFRIIHYRDGIFLRADKANIMNCYFTSNTRYGIFFSGDENTIKDCSLSFNELSGINFTGSRNSFISNDFEQNRVAGMAMLLLCNENIIIDNVITGGVICISNTAVNTTGNIIRNNFLQSSEFGISIYNSRNEISNNIFSDITSIGMLIGGDGNKLSNNTLRNAEQGVIITGKCNIFLRNALSYSQTAGVTVSGNENLLENNVVTNSNIGIINTSEGSLIKNTTFVENKHDLLLADS